MLMNLNKLAQSNSSAMLSGRNNQNQLKLPQIHMIHLKCVVFHLFLLLYVQTIEVYMTSLSWPGER